MPFSPEEEKKHLENFIKFLTIVASGASLFFLSYLIFWL